MLVLFWKLSYGLIGLKAILVQDIEYRLFDNGGQDVITRFSRAAQSVPETTWLDGFYFGRVSTDFLLRPAFSRRMSIIFQIVILSLYLW
jgi:hypothetical protein